MSLHPLQICILLFTPLFNMVANVKLKVRRYKGLPTPSESECESEKDQRTIGRDQRTNGKHQRKISLSVAVNTA